MQQVDPQRPNDRFAAHPGLVSRRIADETILVPVSSKVGDLDAVYTLSPVGSSVWMLLQNPVSLQQMIDAVCAEYDTEAHTAANDLTDFLDALLEKRLIDRTSPGEA